MARGGIGIAILRLRGAVFALQHTREHDRSRHGRQQRVLDPRLARRREVRGNDAGVMRMVNRFPHAHLVQVVLELFSAIQANHVALAVRLPRLGDRRYRAGKAPVGTTEQDIEQAVDHNRAEDAGP